MVIPPIQSFYQKEFSASSDSSRTLSATSTPGSNPAGTNRAPSMETWRPQGTYQRVRISELQPGTGKVRFMGRLVTIIAARADYQPKALSPLQAGTHFLVVKDDTGVIAIKLLGTQSDIPNLQLGKLVTVWTSYVSEYTMAEAIQVPFVSMVVTVHPGPASQSCIKFHQDDWKSEENSLCRIPLEYDPSSTCSQMPGLITLKAFMKGTQTKEKRGDDDLTRVLVCISSVGPRKTLKSNNKSGTLELVEVHVCDETQHCVLKLWNDQITSARTWAAGQTILLITNPKFYPRKKANENPGLGIAMNSIVDVDPEFLDAHWLRRMAENQTKRERVCMPFPDGAWDIEDAINGPNRVLYTLADVDEKVREDVNVVFTGKLNIIILGVTICESQRQNRLCCFECCNFPMYSNQSSATCKNCHKHCELTINPKVIGPVADETGCITPGKLIWSNRAWFELLSCGRRGFGCVDAFEDQEEEQLAVNAMSTGSPSANDDILGTGTDLHESREEIDGAVPQTHYRDNWKQLIGVDSMALRDLEERLLYSRVTLTFGWFSEVKRLCVLGVEW
ncbi:hypothetical protein B0T20DRAFT_474813 [Sordaria brevicollis]|uniref:Replication protein A OB domain-containing protein n=1 Tax=Sordaria brevicollis TaxID=83679 RepID=A0AAE0UG79_SORBR|nr:hypothetical protein B0T20DRAFT_474813 [Sordaria brevicollis]